MKIGNDEPYSPIGLPKPNPDHNPVTEERDTQPDLPALAQVIDRRAEVLRLFPSVERELVERICAIDRMNPSHLNRLRVGNTGGKLTFVEFYCSLTATSYIFFDKCHKHPVPADKRHGVIRPHNKTVLLRAKKTGIPTVMHLWEDQ